MNKIRVIDLLNKIANGEININNKYQFSRDDYCTINDFFVRYTVDEETLNLEIIEDIPKEDKKIEHLKLYPPYPECADDRFEDVENKINEIIDYLNSKGE